MLDAIDATPEQAEQIYNALESAGIEIDVGDILDLLQNSNLEEPEPSESEIQKIEAEKVEDPSVLADSPALGDLVRMYLKEIGKVPLLSAEEEAVLGQQINAGQEAAQKLEALPPDAEENTRRELEQEVARSGAGPSSGWLSPTCGWSSPLPNATLAAVCSCWIWYRRAIWGS